LTWNRQGVTVAVLKIGEIRELIRLLDETSIAELSVETEDMKFHLKKADLAPTQVVAQPVYMSPASPYGAPSAHMPEVSHEAVTSVVEVSPPVVDEALHIVSSPMVGTFYRSPSPDSPPYIELGSKVHDKSVVCIIEAMKLMNEIEAEVTGEVVEVLAQNGQLVEYGQPLLRIRRS
jgi:acetyl-CoA carboxylase biotin carboxyl carrier protein